MTRYIDLSNLKPNDDSIRVYTEEPTIVATLDRKDLQVFKNLTIAQKPGIYILYNDDMRYVGQSTRTIWERFSDHHTKKDWWTKAIVFSRTDGTLDKTQLDRLEKWTWEMLSELGFEVDNIKSPPDGYIAPAQNNKARVLLEKTVEIVTVDAGIDIFKKRFRKKRIQKTNYVEVEVDLTTDVAGNVEKESVAEDLIKLTESNVGLISKVLIHSETYGLIKSDSILQAYSKYLRIMWTDQSENLISGLNNSQIIIETSRVNANKESQYTSIDDSYSFYNVFTKPLVIEDKIKQIAAAASDNITIEKIYHPSLL